MATDEYTTPGLHVPERMRDASGDTGVFEHFNPGDAHLSLALFVEEAVGTDPTLDVAVETSPDGRTSWTEVGAFPRATAPGQWWLKSPVLRVGDFARISWTIGGTGAPGFRFSVHRWL